MNILRPNIKRSSSTNDINRLNFFEESFKQNSFTENEVKSGWLEKQTKGVIKRWQLKFCILKSNTFSYYSKTNSKQPSGCFNFKQLFIQIQAKTQTSFLITITGCKRNFLFRALNSEEASEWIASLRLHIEGSLGQTCNIEMLSLQKNFWKFPQISVFEFLDCAKTGDILLFKTNCLISKAQRTVTRSNYDHVALLIKHSGYVAFLESTRVIGVNVLFWEEFIEKQWHLLYDYLVYRKLMIKDPEGLENIVKTFITETIGKKFNASIKKIIGKRETNGNEGYFCSELVASAYKKAGILPSDVPSSNYWPGNFAGERPLFLINASLGPLTRINFDIQ